MFAFRMRPIDDFMFAPVSSIFDMNDDDWEDSFWRDDDSVERRDKRAKRLLKDNKKEE